MGGGSGGGGNGDRSGGGGSATPADAGQPGEVFREANKANEVKVKKVLVSGGQVQPGTKAYDKTNSFSSMVKKDPLDNYDWGGKNRPNSERNWDRISTSRGDAKPVGEAKEGGIKGFYKFRKGEKRV